MLTKMEIARLAKRKRITDIALRLGIPDTRLIPYGWYKAKVVGANECDRHGKLILVTAITPTPMGEGKTTTAIGLADALNHVGAFACAALREPSLGPVFGVKGGATGGGYAQVVPMDDINLHFTGDFHAIGAANNLLAAMLDNHIQQGNALDIDTRRIVWKRAIDMNDRALRDIVIGLGGKANGVPREDAFDITVASEVMAAFCLATDLADLKARLGRMIVAYTRSGTPVTCHDLKAEGAMTALLKDALAPNLVQTLENTPVFIHGGPFANIAHGCNSVIATKLALSSADYVVTEAGFGADLGAEKFIDIKCRQLGQMPSAVVVVATVRALKLHGGADKKSLAVENLDALKKGMPNLKRHLSNIQDVYKLPCVVAINRFPDDTESELDLVRAMCADMGVEVALSEVLMKGGAGGADLARKVLALCDTPSTPEFAYPLDIPVVDKIDRIARRVYRADGVEFTPEAKRDLRLIAGSEYDDLPVCMAKTQYSFSDDPKKLGAPERFTITVRGLRVSAGAGFVVALTGDIMTMPGLPKIPAAEAIDVDADGNITGLF